MRGDASVVIDCKGVTSAAEFWQLYLDTAKPSDGKLFGRNLDAFWDAVEFGGPGWPGNVELVFTHSSQLEAVEAANGRSLLDGLRNVADEATQMRIVFD